MMNQNEVSTELTLAGSQRLVDDWIQSVGVRYFNELTNMAMLTEEVGEVARIIARRYGEQSEKPSDAEKVLADELAGVLFVLMCVGNASGVDVELFYNNNSESRRT